MLFTYFIVIAMIECTFKRENGIQRRRKKSELNCAQQMEKKVNNILTNVFNKWH